MGGQIDERLRGIQTDGQSHRQPNCQGILLHTNLTFFRHQRNQDTRAWRRTGGEELQDGFVQPGVNVMKLLYFVTDDEAQ